MLSLGFSARLNGRFGPRAVLLVALASIAAGLALLSQVPVDGRYVVDLLPAMVLLGVGGGLAFPALMTLAMSSVRPEDSGLASGLVNTTQQVGGALGLAILASVAESRTGDATAAAALVDGYSAAFTVAAAFVVAALVVGAVVLRRGAGAGVAASRPSPTAERASRTRAASRARAARARRRRDSAAPRHARRRVRRQRRLAPPGEPPRRARLTTGIPAVLSPRSRGMKSALGPVRWEGGAPVGALLGPVRA